MLLVVAVLGGLVAGLLRPRAGGHGARPHLHQPVLVGAGLGLLVASALVEGDIATVTGALGLAALLTFVGVNRSVTGLLVLGLGLLANLAALVLNNGMPVRPDALVEADVVERSELADHDLRGLRHLETDADAFDWLGAIVPVPLARQVVSFGDLLVLVGLTDAVRDLARRRSRVHPVERSGGTADDDAGADGVEDGGAGRASPGDDGYDATTQAKVDHDWGAAPSDAPESGSQYSEKPETTAADVSAFWSDSSVTPSPAHLAARHDK